MKFTPTVRCAALILAMSFPGAANAQTSDEQIFRNPELGSHPLNACLRQGEDCGAPAAGLFCRRQQFHQVSSFEIGPASGRSQHFLTDSICEGDQCTVFTQITCAEPFKQAQIFENPAWGDERLDSCLTWGEFCGQTVADRFCEIEGFSGAADFILDRKQGQNKTRFMSTNEVCQSGGCTGFQTIICRPAE